MYIGNICPKCSISPAKEKADDRLASKAGSPSSGVDSDSIVASCECFKLSPNPIHHAKGCKYRLICEREEITRLRAIMAATRQATRNDAGCRVCTQVYHVMNAELSAENAIGEPAAGSPTP
jgi:hypothetical protein